MTGTFWNGLPTPARRGTAVVAPSPEFPQHWARELVGQRIDVVEVVLDGVNYGGGIDYLDDRDGSGWRKVTEGHGGPRYGHASLSIEEGSFKPREERATGGIITIPKPTVPFGPAHLSEDEGTAHYLRELAGKIDRGSITVGGSNVTATVRKLLLDVVETLEANQDYREIFGRDPEPWRDRLGALRLTLTGEPAKVDIERAQAECETLVRVLNGHGV